MKTINDLPLAAIGIPWYERDAYARIRSIMDDPDMLPERFDEWLEVAHLLENEIKTRGQRVIRAIIEPEQFRSWCLSRGKKPNAKSRRHFAAQFAMDHAAASVKAD